MLLWLVAVAFAFQTPPQQPWSPLRKTRRYPVHHSSGPGDAFGSDYDTADSYAAALASDASDILDDDGWPEETDEEDLLELEEMLQEREADDRELRRLLAELKSEFQNKTDDASRSINEAVANCEAVLEEEKKTRRKVPDDVFDFTPDARVALAFAATQVDDETRYDEDRLLGVIDTAAYDSLDDDLDDDDDVETEEKKFESDDETYSWLLGNTTDQKVQAPPPPRVVEEAQTDEEDDEVDDEDEDVQEAKIPMVVTMKEEEVEEEATVAIGMDLGTTNSGGGVVIDGEPRLVPPGLRPSVVCFVDTDVEEAALISGTDNSAAIALRDDEGGRVYAVVGNDAESLRGGAHGASVCSRVKRILGRDATRAEQRRVGALRTTGGLGTMVTLHVPAFRRRIPAFDVSAEIARQIKRDCDAYLAPKKATRCVVGVPARFDDEAREATLIATENAGFDDVRLLEEPAAAVLAYGARRAKERRRQEGGSTNETIFVFDLGGGTFDASVVELRDNDAELLAVGGDAKLGGDDFDAVLAEWLAVRFFKKHGMAVKSPTARLRLLAEAERCKRALSSAPSVRAKARCLARIDTTTGARARGGKPLDLDEDINRTTFERLCRPLLRDVERSARVVLEAANVKHRPPRKKQDAAPPGDRDLDAVLLVGGATRMPVIGRMLRRITGLPLSHIVANNDLHLNPDEAVALGCAILANTLDQKVGHTTDGLAAPFELATTSTTQEQSS